MKFSYKFSNLLGTVYKRGNLVFTNDGNSLISAVGNRITVYDLKNNKSSTLPFESRFNYTTVALSPCGSVLIAINEEGDAHLVSLVSQTIIHQYRFKRKIRDVKFSPDGKYFAVCKENNVFVFKSPNAFIGDYNCFVMERVFHDAADETTCIDWSFDSRILAVGSKDNSTRLYALDKFKNFNRYALSSHSNRIVGVFFEKDSYDLITVCRNGHACVWECSLTSEDLQVGEYDPPKKKKRQVNNESDDDVDTTHRERTDDQLTDEINQLTINSSENRSKTSGETPGKFFYKRLARHYLADVVKKDTNKKDVICTSASYHAKTRILVIGFSNGAFFLYESPEMNMIHSLGISDHKITSIALNNTGDWIALGCSDLGQLLVWEWQSETYVMKQQGHANDMTSVSYSADGQYIATGGLDGKLKLWNVNSGFCFVTFDEHTAAITGVEFSVNKKFVVSSSLDGTVRAYDVIRYRNFRTFTSPRPAQFSCLAIDNSGEFVCAGGQDVFEIFLWSVKFGRLLEILSGHGGPVCGLAFNPSPTSTALASISWDKTLKLWNALENGSQHETIELISDGLCVVYKPNGEEVAVATLNGNISIFNVKTSTQIALIEGKNDLGTGRANSDLITAKQTQKSKAFTTLCYSADGEYILAAGQSKFVCIYHVKEALLVKKFEITQNRSLDAVDDFINRRKMTEYGNLALVEQREEREGGRIAVKLPGTKQTDDGQRTVKPEVRVFGIKFSPTGEAWAATTTEGLLVYSLNSTLLFDPWGLELDITPETIRQALDKKEYLDALTKSLKLNENDLIHEVIEQVPHGEIDFIVRAISSVYVERLAQKLTKLLSTSAHVEYYLTWVISVLNHHYTALTSKNTLVGLHRVVQQKFDEMRKICDYNTYTINYISQLSSHVQNRKVKDENDGLMDSDDLDERV